MRNDTVTPARPTAGARSPHAAALPCSAMHAPRRAASYPPVTRMQARLALGDLESLDEAGVDQQPVETPRFGAIVALIEQPVAALHDLLLLDEAGIARQARGFLDDQRQIRRIEPVQRGRHVHRPEG